MALAVADTTPDAGDTILNCLDRAVEAGDQRAKFARACCFVDGKYGSLIENKAANALFLQLEDSDIAEALFAAAYCYDVGDGVIENKLRAFSLYLKAAILGHKDANWQVSEFFREDVTVPHEEGLVEFFKARSELEERLISPPQRLQLRPIPAQ